jgi:hypothetical protein
MCRKLAASSSVRVLNGAGTLGPRQNAGAASAGINDLVWFQSFRGELSRVELWCAEPASEVHPEFRGK